MKSSGSPAAGGWREPVSCMKTREAARDVPRASQPGPKRNRAATPIAAHPMCATNILYFFAAGVLGAAKSTAHTAPKGAMVKVSPMGSINMSRADMAAIATKAPAAGHTMSLRGGEGDEEEESGLEEGTAAAEEEANTNVLLLLLCLTVVGSTYFPTTKWLWLWRCSVELVVTNRPLTQIGFA